MPVLVHPRLESLIRAVAAVRVPRMTEMDLRTHGSHALWVRPSILRNVSCLHLGRGTLADMDVRLKTLGTRWSRTVSDVEKDFCREPP